jgi:hypothetical protein
MMLGNMRKQGVRHLIASCSAPQAVTATIRQQEKIQCRSIDSPTRARRMHADASIKTASIDTSQLSSGHFLALLLVLANYCSSVLSRD